MRLEGRIDPEVSARMSEVLLMKEFPQLDPDKIDALPLRRAAYYIALAEDMSRRRRAAAKAGRIA